MHQCALCWEELFVSLSMTVVAGEVISIRGVGASGSSPSTPAEAANKDYREWAERLQQTGLHRCATPAWSYGALCPSLVCCLVLLPKVG